MQFDNALADRQPQAKPARLACQARINAVEAIKDALEMSYRNTLAMIGDAHLQHMMSFCPAFLFACVSSIPLLSCRVNLDNRANGHVDQPAIWRIGNRIFQ